MESVGADALGDGLETLSVDVDYEGLVCRSAACAPLLWE